MLFGIFLGADSSVSNKHALWLAEVEGVFIEGKFPSRKNLIFYGVSAILDHLTEYILEQHNKRDFSKSTFRSKSFVSLFKLLQSLLLCIMAAEKKGKLTARGAPIMASPYLKHPELSDSDRIDSGFVDSFKSDESKSESMTMIQEITEKMSINDTTAEFVCDDASTNTRHPQPCSPPKPTSNSPKETAPCMSPVDSMLSFAQSNDVRHLLAPYRHHLLVQNEDGDT